jgi:hypothetical protein
MPWWYFAEQTIAGSDADFKVLTTDMQSPEKMCCL